MAIANQRDWWNIAAAAGFAMKQVEPNLSGETVVIYTQPCCCGSGCVSGGSCMCGAELYIDESDAGNAHAAPGADERYVIAHEVGHILGKLRNGPINPFNISYGATEDQCDGDGSSHRMNSKEYHGAAASEGWAQYVSAVTWNDTSETDCRFRYYKDVDWDNNNVINPAWGEELPQFDCDGPPVTANPGHSFTAADYLGTECDGTLTHRGVEYDWLRFFWDLTENAGYTPRLLLEVWDGSDPHSWNEEDLGLQANFAYPRMKNAAGDLGEDTGVFHAWGEINGVIR